MINKHLVNIFAFHPISFFIYIFHANSESTSAQKEADYNKLQVLLKAVFPFSEN